MAEFFDIVALALTGLLDISNKVIGILIAWTILGVPLLFILATYDFVLSLLKALNMTDDDEENIFQRQYFETELGSITSGDIADQYDFNLREFAKRKGYQANAKERKKILKATYEELGIIEEQEE